MKIDFLKKAKFLLSLTFLLGGSIGEAAAPSAQSEEEALPVPSQPSPRDLQQKSPLFPEKKLRMVTIEGRIDEKQAYKAIQELINLDNQNCEQPIYVFINSLKGSSVFSDFQSTLLLYDVLKCLRSPVIRIGEGLVDFCGALCLSGGIKGGRFIYPHTSILLEPQAFLEGAPTPEIFSRRVKEWEHQKNTLQMLFSLNTGQSLETVQSWLEKGFVFFTPEQAISLGFVDNTLLGNPLTTISVKMVDSLLENPSLNPLSESLPPISSQESFPSLESHPETQNNPEKEPILSPQPSTPLPAEDAPSEDLPQGETL